MNSSYQEPEGYLNIAIIGPKDSGKTSLMRNLTGNAFQEMYFSNSNFERERATQQIAGNNIKVTATTAGPKWGITNDQCGWNTLIITYDVTDMDSFKSVKDWLIKNYNDYKSDTRELILVGTKCDLIYKKQVDYDHAKEFADSIGIPFLEHSAKNNINSDKLLSLAAKSTLVRCKEQKESAAKLKAKPLSDPISVLQEEIRKYNKLVAKRCGNRQSPTRNTSMTMLKEKIEEITATDNDDNTKLSNIISLIKGHINATRSDHRSGCFGFFKRLTTSDLTRAYEKALTAFPKDLVDNTAAAEVDLFDNFKIYVIPSSPR